MEAMMRGLYLLGCSLLAATAIACGTPIPVTAASPTGGVAAGAEQECPGPPMDAIAGSAPPTGASTTFGLPASGALDGCAGELGGGMTLDADFAFGRALKPPSGETVNWKDNGTFLKSGHLFVDTMGGPIRVTLPVPTRIVECQKTKDQQTLNPDGTDSTTAITYEECERISPLPVVPDTVVPINLPWATRLRAPSKGHFVDITTEEFTVITEKEETTVAGELAGEWSNSTSELTFPETPLEESNLKSEGGKVVYSGNDKYKLVCGGTLEVGEE